MNKAGFKWGAISEKQKKILCWWTKDSPYKDYDGIIADGAIRSGKTVGMGFSFVIWAMTCFDGMDFAICGKTIGSLRRNVINGLRKQLASRGYKVDYKRSDNLIVVQRGDVANNFYLFGGKDESSQDLIQGMTLAGILFDEVALMPESFVNQATARCSVEGSKFWFNCNPAGPMHWFKQNWINRCREKNLVYLHFTMDDNLTLSERIKARYRGQYVGVFFARYILGLWVIAEGIIYKMFNEKKHVTDAEMDTEGHLYVSSDYGIQNPNVWLKWAKIKDSNRWYCANESVFSGKESQEQKTVQELVDDLDIMMDGVKPKYVIIDPSASAMKAELRKRGYKVKDADNDVLDGIADVQTMLQEERLIFSKKCVNCRKEFGAYAWDSKASDRGEDKPVKQHDHCITGDSLIETENGMVKIKDMVGTKGKVWSYSRLLKRKVLLPYRDCRKTQESVDVYEVTLDNGKKIRATSDHRVLTQNGYKPIKMLKTTDKLSCFN